MAQIDPGTSGRGAVTSSHAYISSIPSVCRTCKVETKLILAWSFPLLALMPKLRRLQEKNYVKSFTLYYSVCG